jgi:hypothetical protein
MCSNIPPVYPMDMGCTPKANMKLRGALLVNHPFAIYMCTYITLSLMVLVIYDLAFLKKKCAKSY